MVNLLRRLEMFAPRKSKKIIEMVPVLEEFISPEEAIKAITENRSEIESIKFQLPVQIGSGDFGTFRVKWKTPRYHGVSFDDV